MATGSVIPPSGSTATPVAAVTGIGRGDLDLMLNAVPAATWQALERKRLFVTGGTGFVGCWLLEALLHADRQRNLGLEITVLTRQPERFEAKAPHLARHPALALLQGDVRQMRDIRLHCDMVIHGATDVVDPDGDPQRAYDDIVEGTRETLALCARAGATRFLYVSSGAVYGVQPPEVPRITEMHPVSPDGGSSTAAYGLGKRVSEWMAMQAGRAHGFDVVHARLFALLGPYLPLDAHFAAGNFVADALAERPIAVGGNGAPLRSYLYGADMAVWLVTLLVKGESGKAYNVGSEDAISIVDLAQTVSDLCGQPVRVADSTQPSGLPPRYVPDTDLTRSSLGLAVHTDLRSALQRTLDWNRQANISETQPPKGPHR